MKTKSSYLFVVFILLLLVGWVELDFQFRDYFSDRKDLLKQSENLTAKLERQKLRVQLAEAQNWDFQQEVARMLPIKIQVHSPRDFKLAELAQTVRAPAAELRESLNSEVLMMRGREEFKLGHYGQAADLFHEVIEKFPASAQVIEAHFLWGESLFQGRRMDECLDVVYQMLNLFPENEMTGYLLLRDGQILMSRHRTEEAQEIFKTVSERFQSSKPLQEQARRLASE
jgi:TolA-binding protein